MMSTTTIKKVKNIRRNHTTPKGRGLQRLLSFIPKRVRCLSLTVRSTISGSCARNWRLWDMSSRPAPILKFCWPPIRSGVRTVLPGWSGCSPSPSGSPATGGFFWPETGWARSRFSTRFCLTKPWSSRRTILLLYL